MATPCYTVYIPVMKEYLKRANFLDSLILYRLSLATERERRLTTARANQTNGLTNGRGTNWTSEVKFSRFRALSRRQMTLLIQRLLCVLGIGIGTQPQARFPCEYVQRIGLFASQQ